MVGDFVREHSSGLDRSARSEKYFRMMVGKSGLMSLLTCSRASGQRTTVHN